MGREETESEKVDSGGNQEGKMEREKRIHKLRQMIDMLQHCVC